MLHSSKNQAYHYKVSSSKSLMTVLAVSSAIKPGTTLFSAEKKTHTNGNVHINHTGVMIIKPKITDYFKRWMP